MTLPSPHKEWVLERVLLPAVRWADPDRLMTQLWLRLEHEDRRTTPRTSSYLNVAEIAETIESGHPRFDGFEAGSGVAESWLRADLLKTLRLPEFSRSRSKGDYAVARPLHLDATKLRNTKRDEDGNASAIPYRWIGDDGGSLHHELIDWLTAPDTGPEGYEDLPSYALAVLAREHEDDVPVGGTRTGDTELLCEKSGRLYREDLKSLLAYRRTMPRVAVLDHVRRITMLHIALYLLQTYAIITRIESDPDGDRGCDCFDDNRCGLLPKLVVDCGEDPTSEVAKLAEASWVEVETALSSYVRSHWTLRKLVEFADASENRDKNLQANDLKQIARLAGEQHRRTLDAWAHHRIDDLVRPRTGIGRDAEESRNREEARSRFVEMGLPPFETYMSILFMDGERRWFNYHRQLLDSMFAKNAKDGLMLQPIGGRRRRRLALSPPLLETIVLASMIRFDDGGPVTRPIRVDQLIDRLDERYGLLVTRPPRSLEDDPGATRAMIANKETFLARLRQTGLYVDQSDAFLSQKIQPRVRLS